MVDRIRSSDADSAIHQEPTQTPAFWRRIVAGMVALLPKAIKQRRIKSARADRKICSSNPVLPLVCFLTALFSLGVPAKMPDFYKEPGLNPNRDYVSHHFGENIDPFSGSLQLKYTDISIPGNGGFSLNVVRSYSSSGFKRDAPGAGVTTAGLGWTMHFGRIYRSTNVSASFCVNQVTTSTTDNPVLELPDGSTELFAFVSQTGNELRSRRQWKMTCSATGLIAYSPDGTRYDMDKQQLTPVGITSYYTTKITDRNGNYANISYNAYSGTTPSVAEISAVSTSDGRSLSFSYLEPGTISSRISSITGPGGTVSYSYTSIGTSSFPHIYFLTGVSRPSENSWAYSYNPYSSSGTVGSLQMNSLTMPYGGVISYTYQNVTFNSAEIPSSVISAKSASGSWSYSFAPASSIGSEDTTTVSTPSGSEVYKHWGPNGVDSGTVWKIGLLNSKTLGSEQTETYTWSSLPLGAEAYQRDGSWFAKKDTTTLLPILSSRSITRNGGVYSTTYSGHDSYGNPSTVSETGPNSGSRTNNITYFTDTAKWIIGFKKNETANEKGRAIDRVYDAVGNLTSISRDGATTTYTYTAAGDVASMYTPNGKTTTYGSHSRSVPQTETRPESVSVSRIVSSAGNVTSETVGGQTFTYTYDGINRITGITYPAGSAVSVSYSSSSKTVTRGSLVESTSYNGYGYPTSVTLGGIATTYSVDAFGRRTFESNPGVASGTSYTYDILGRLTGITFADAGVKSYSYGSSQTSITDERSNTTTYSFRSYGNPDYQALTSIASPLQATAIGLNSRDLITSVTQGGKSRTYGYDSKYYVTSITEPETGTTIFGRDANGNQTSRQVGTSGTTTYTYDGLDRLTGVAYPGGPTIAKTYNGRGRLLSVTGGDASRSLSYDGNDNLTSETLTIGTVSLVASYAYNTLDQLTSTTYPKTARVVEYAPNSLGRPSKVGTFVTGVTYHNSGQVNAITYANGTSSTYGQNSRLWPSTFVTTKSANYISSSYTYDKVGNLTSIADSIDSVYSRTLGYDTINRLTSATGPWGSGTIAYDGRGNITSMGLTGGSISYTYDGNDRLGSIAGARTAAFTYGNYGEVSSDGSNAYTYDQVPNLKSVNSTDAVEKVEYQYDGLNNRASRSKAGVPTYEFYSSRGQLLLEYTPSAAEKTVEHFYLGNLRVAQVTKDTTVAVQATNTNLSAAPSSVACGVNATLSATVAPSSVVGNVEFYSSGALIGTTAVSNGSANLLYAFSAIGAKSLTAKYVPTAGQPFTTSTTATAATLTVMGTAPAITSTLTSPQPRQGTAMSLSIQVTGCGVAGTGTAVLKNSSGTTVASSALSAAKTASFSITSPTVATNYSVSYTESGLAAPLALSESVPAGPTTNPTSISVSASPTSGSYGTTIVLTVTGVPEAANITFAKVGAAGSIAVVPCRPTLTCSAAVTNELLGTHTYTASFPASTNYSAATATSNSVSITSGTGTGGAFPALFSAYLDKSTILEGDSVTAYYRVIRNPALGTMPAPTGYIYVIDGSQTIFDGIGFTNVGSLPGIAFADGSHWYSGFGTSTLGTRPITIRYSGDSTYRAETLVAGYLTVLPRRPSVTELKKSPALSVFGQPLTISAAVVYADGSAVVSSGNVSLVWDYYGALSGQQLIATVPVQNGLATFTVPTGVGAPLFKPDWPYAASGVQLKAIYSPLGTASDANASESGYTRVRMYTEQQRRAIITSIILGDDE